MKPEPPSTAVSSPAARPQQAPPLLRRSLLICCVAFITCQIPGSAQSNDTSASLPYPTGTHLQLVRRFYTLAEGLPDNKVQAVTVTRDGITFAAGGKELARLEGERFVPQSGPIRVAALFSPAEGPKALAGATNGLWSWSEGRWEIEPGGPSNVIAFAAEPSGIPWALCPIGVWRRENRWQLIHTVEDDDMSQPCHLLPGESNALLVASPNGLFGMVGKRRYWLRLEVRPGGLLSSTVRALAWLNRDHFLVATDKGLNLSNGSARGWLGLTGEQGLPITDLTHVRVAAEGTVWLGSQQGLVRWNNGEWTYFSGKRWLPDDRVIALEPGNHGSVWVGTTNGLAHVFPRKLTLAEKAAILQKDLESRDRRHGYVTEMVFRAPGTLEGALQELSDNDGMWTALYIASQSFRYAATKAPEAKAQAWRSMQALLRLETITGIPGFPARAICHKDEPQFATRSARSQPEWHESPVEKGWHWKGETSSDEIVGHYFGWHVFYELAADEAQKQAVAATCKRVTDHILKNHYYLIDKDGQPTTWGFWGPDKINEDPKYWHERGLGSLEILSHLKVASKIVGDPHYERAYRDLLKSHQYALNTLPAKVPGGVSHDDQLLMLSYYPLLQLERDPGLRAIYCASLKLTWEAERVEANPLWNFIYGACTGQPHDIENTVRALREMPLDFIKWQVRNSHRADIKQVSGRPLQWSERVIHNWDHSPYDLDAGSDWGEADQTVWLLPYWMGMYHGLIK